MSDFPYPEPHNDAHHFDMRLRFEHEFANGVSAIALVDLDKLRADTPGIELSIDSNVAPMLRRAWESSVEEQTRRIMNLLDNAPAASQGAHTFLARVATWTATHWTAEQAYRWLRDYGDRCGRHVPDREINEAIVDGRKFAGVHDNGKSDGDAVSGSQLHLKSLCSKSPRWPEPDQIEIEQICRSSPRLAELSAASPSPIKDDAPRTEEIIDRLFGSADPWLCCGVASYEFSTKRRESWRGSLLEQSFIVPSAMIGRFGFTKNDEVSEHAQSAVGARQYLVVEFDFAEKSRDGKQDTALGPLIRRLAVDHIAVADMCASLLAHLAKFAPLALLVHSGGKSLHGWFPCAGIAEDELRKFMAYACELGADPKTWTASQFVRMPDGLRYDHGQAPRRQHVCFFNPEVIAHD
jgi:hypothetical protein